MLAVSAIEQMGGAHQNAVLLHMPCSVLLGIDQPPQCVMLYVYRDIVGEVEVEVGMGMGMQSPHMQPGGQ